MSQDPLSGAIELGGEPDDLPDTGVARFSRLVLDGGYRFEILPSLKDTSGASFKPYRLTFTTGGSGNAVTLPVAFEKTTLPQTAGHVYTSVAPQVGVVRRPMPMEIYLAEDFTLAS